MRNATDPVSELVEAAVERALERKWPELVQKLPKLPPAPPSVPETMLSGDPFMPLQEAAKYIRVHRTTLLRWEKAGLIVPRRKLPGGKTGWLKSEIDLFLANLKRDGKKVA